VAAAQERFYRQGLDDINAKGGFKVGNQTYTFTSVTVDDKYSADGGQQAATQLALAEKVNVVFGGASASSAGAQPVYEQAKVLQMAYVATDAILGPAHPFTFQVGYAHFHLRYATMYDWLAKAHPEVKRSAIVVIDDAGAAQIQQQAPPEAARNGITLVTTEKIPADIKSFDPLALRLVSQNIQAIDMTGLATMPAIFPPLVKALYAQGFRGVLFGYSASIQNLIDAGPGAEGFVYQTLADWNVPAVPETEKAVIRAYIAKYGADQLQMTGEPAYVAASVLAQAMVTAGTVTDASKIADVFRSGAQFDSMWGKVGFGGLQTLGARVALDAPLYFTKFSGGTASTIDMSTGRLP
jgi:branched-chain amino acid transport system substrate-binding protein